MLLRASLLPFEKSSTLSTIEFISLLLFASVSSQQFLGSVMKSSCQLHPGQPFLLKTWSYESLASQQSLASFRMEQGRVGQNTPFYSSFRHSLSPSLSKTNTMVLVCENFFMGEF